MNLFEMKSAREAAIARAEAAVVPSETGNRAMTEGETTTFNAAMAEANALTPQIASKEALSTLRSQFPKGQVITEPGAAHVASRGAFTAEYASDFAKWAASKGTIIGGGMAAGQDELGGFKFPGQRKPSAAMYEGAVTGGSGAAGGFAVPSQVEGTFVPLAPPEMGIYKLAQVLPTSFDLRFPVKSAHGTAVAKAESTTSTPTTFGGTDPSLATFTLSAFMLGHSEDASWELLQDGNAFQSFITDDVLLSLAVLKEQWFINGTGPAQGLIGNTAAGITGVTATSEAEATLNSAILDATIDVLGALNAVYHPGASYLMNRVTSILIRKAQKTANLFEPIFVRSGGQDYLNGYAVEYSSAMPLAVSGNTPIVFGDFKRGYLIGERGGAGVNVKILDQPKALQGLLTILGYQRVDGRVRRSEALQAITLG